MHTHKDTINIPELSLVVLMGASGSGKSTFAKQHFLPAEIVSSDACRALVGNDENAQQYSGDAFDLARYIISKRLKNGLLTVIDATNVRDEDRADWVRLAREFHVLPVAIVLNMPEKVCAERHALRADRSFGPHVIPKQTALLKRGIRRLRQEGFRHVHELRSPQEVETIARIVREPLFNNRKSETGPFDIIGDIHGCHTELVELLQQLNYRETDGVWRHPEGRRLVFLGDLVDRGPATPAVLKLVMKQVKEGAALCVPGNHDVKLVRWLNGKNVQLKHGLEQTVAQLSSETPAFHEEIKLFLDGLVSHYVLDEGKLVVAHAGLKEEMQGRGSGKVREFCYYGETTGETDEFGLPVRHNWAAEYNGKAMVVYGHTPVPQPQWLNRTIDIDTGCVFGGSLTALRYPERDIVSVPAKTTYCEPVRPLHAPAATGLTLQQQHDDVLNIADFNGKMLIENRYGGPVTIREQNTIAALEVMSRFTINPKWLIYLPPTMSPSETSKLPGLLEHPAEAFSYFKGVGVTKVICEEKHMGSRAVVIVAKDEKTVETVFGIKGEGIGTVYTRTGRAFFTDRNMEQALLQRLNQALCASGFYEKFNTDWACFDCELMPWSAKALNLIETQYASTGTAAKHALDAAVNILQQNAATAALLEKYTLRQQQAGQFTDAYRQYCWPVNGLDDYKLAPFHIMATAGKTWFHQHHEWHMEEIAAFCEHDGILLATPYKVVYLEDETQLQEAIDWWNDLTGKGGEGMVVKSYQYLHQYTRGIAQPAIKVRGREYLRIIYGAEYTTPAYLERLKARGLSAKRSLALREFVLGLEGLERFVAKDSLKNVHECVFGVLALESEPVDPRL